MSGTPGTERCVVGVVAIGRNEGERLVQCLESLRSRDVSVVYADSGSRDGSPERARALGAGVVELDPALPFSAARGRNEGFARLMGDRPHLELVQFVDADCELHPEWLDAASAYLGEHPGVAVVCGRRHERHPDASVYNRLADLEWDTPIGDALSCGGDAMLRADVLREAGGYAAEMIAGEEPELCLRIRQRGHRVVRLDREMTLHDAAMTRFGQWWRRQARSGHAYAEILQRHGAAAEAFWKRRVGSILAWGLALPAVAVAGAWPSSGLSLALLAGYGVLWLRVYASRRRRGDAARLCALYATACTLGKVAEAQGALTFAWRRLSGRVELIEYK